MKQPVSGYILIILAVAALVMACATGTGAQQTPKSDDAPPPTDPRSDCNEILGTPFRSADERTWFNENCSKWPLIDVGSVATVQQPPECASMRGKPYTSSEQRQWYLANCNDATPTQSRGPSSGSQFSTPGQPSNSGSTSQQPNTPAQASNGGDRTDCNAIRGGGYRSSAERAWFLANCTGSNAQQSSTSSQPAQQTGPQPPVGDRTDCNAIRGDGYRSSAERAWFLANCTGSSAAQSSTARPEQPPQPPQPAGPQAAPGDRTDCYAIGGTRYRSTTEQAWFEYNCLGRR